MKDLPFVTYDVFTEVPFGGNPLAVFPDARALDQALMQVVARKFNLSETLAAIAIDRGAAVAMTRGTFRIDADP